MLRARRLLAAILAECLLLTASSAPGAAAPQVVASLKPIHALAAAIMEGVAAPKLIVQGAASEHLYVMKPSDAAALNNADFVFWVGPMMEDFLIRPLVSLPSHVRPVALADVPGLERLTVRAQGAFDPDGGETSKDGQVIDGHIWLDPGNARIMAAFIAKILSDADSKNAPAYAANARRLDGELVALDAELAAKLAPLNGRPFIVFHDAYHYLEVRYGLSAVGAVTLHPGLSASARRLSQLRARIRAAGVVCAFAEPQFEPKLLNNLIAGTGLKTGVLDPIGATLAPGRGAYFVLMRNLARALSLCLSPS